MCKTLSIALKKHNETVIVVSLYSQKTEFSETLEENGIKVIYLNKKKGFDIKCLFKLFNIVKNEKPDVIHTHLHTTKYAVLANLFFRAPIFHTFHSVAQKENTRFGITLNKLFIKAKLMVPVAICDEVQKTICEVYSISEDNVPVVHNGIDLSRFKPSNIEKKDFIIINVGRLATVKNQLSLIKAFEIIVKKYKCKLWLLGNGELYNEIYSYVNNSQYKDSIVLWGDISDPESYLCKSSLFVLPSFYEGFPMSVIEAMACGVPVIASNVSGIKEMITNGYNGILIEPSIENIADSIEKIILDTEIRDKYISNSLNVVKNYSNENMMINYLDLYGNRKYDRKTKNIK